MKLPTVYESFMRGYFELLKYLLKTVHFNTSLIYLCEEYEMYVLKCFHYADHSTDYVLGL